MDRFVFNSSADGANETHLSDERVIVDFDVYVDRSVRKCLENLSEEGDACVLSPLAEKLCRQKHSSFGSDPNPRTLEDSMNKM